MSSTPSSLASSATQPTTPPSPSLCTPLHVLYCFDVLVAHFEKRDPIDPPFENQDEPFALFVTWNTTSSFRPGRKPTLRGCIGNFSPMPLARGLREYALTSALEDHRFSPIKSSELPNLSCSWVAKSPRLSWDFVASLSQTVHTDPAAQRASLTPSVSLLSPFTPIPSPLDWTPGFHGIHISFPHPQPHGHSRTLSATYLPEVTPEQGWTREEALISAIRKAGWHGRVSVGDEVWGSLRVRRYGSDKAGCGYRDWVDWKAGKGVVDGAGEWMRAEEVLVQA